MHRKKHIGMGLYLRFLKKHVDNYVIQMCERAGLLDPIEPVNYNLLTEEDFDWDLWIQQESGKR
jgi:hypothetical protein